MADTLKPENDPMGAAILDFAKNGKARCRLKVLSSMFDDDEMEVRHLFRTPDQMPELERKALDMATGRILDVGAGAGCHALALQEAGHDVTAIDISDLSCQAMAMRGIDKVRCINLYDSTLTGPFDTILLLMNGTGIAGKVAGVPRFLLRLKELLANGGQVLIDSSDLRYVYEDEDGNLDFDPSDGYYGEVDYRMTYGKVRGERFDWLYLEFPLLQAFAQEAGLHAELVAEGDHYDYLARLYM